MAGRGLQDRAPTWFGRRCARSWAYCAAMAAHDFILFDLDGTLSDLGLCTSKRRDFALKILALFGLDHHFALVDGGEIGVHKWQQIAALRAAGRVGDASLMVGDRAVDLEGACQHAQVLR